MTTIATSKDALLALRANKALVGRSAEIDAIVTVVASGKNLLLEGPVGVGKTFLVQSIVESLGIPFFRVDGDSRFSEQKLSGWFDPPSVLKKGYSTTSFMPGPLYKAMEMGGVLFLNELNRLPEGVQNVLLPVLDEGILQVPHLKPLRAKKGFCVVATMNPREFVATSQISEAVLDRFELLWLDYQSEAEEIAILANKLPSTKKSKAHQISTASLTELAQAAVQITRATRESPLFKRGASVRAAISIRDYVLTNMQLHEKEVWGPELFAAACRIVLATRIELSESGSEIGFERAIEKILEEFQKKN